MSEVAKWNYYCFECKKHFDNGAKTKDSPATCIYCGNENSDRMKVVGRKAFNIGEPKEGHEPISSKSDKYWESAERDRINRLKKSASEEAEKIRYDEKYRQKMELRKKRLEMKEGIAPRSKKNER